MPSSRHVFPRLYIDDGHAHCSAPDESTRECLLPSLEGKSTIFTFVHLPEVFAYQRYRLEPLQQKMTMTPCTFGSIAAIAAISAPNKI